MDLSIAANLFSISFFAAVVFTGFFRTLAKRYKILIDLPDKNRKFHKRPTPLVGGLGIHAAMLFGLSLLFLTIDSKVFDLKDNVASLKTNVEVVSNEDSQSYKVTANKSDSTNERAIEVMVDGYDSPISVRQNSEGVFEVLDPDGNIKLFSYTDGAVQELNSAEQFIVVGPASNQYFNFTSLVLAVVFASILLQLIIIIDDLRGLPSLARLMVQAGASVLVIALSGDYLTNLGFEILGWNGELGWFGMLFTVFAVTGMMNAFNMIDGINGLCSGMVLSALSCLLLVGVNSSASLGLFITIGSLLGFMLYNMGLFGKKRAVFLGDNGSNFLGFMLAWTLIHYSSADLQIIRPVTALWLVAIPLWDTIILIVNRLRSGQGAFIAGRDHIHHILFDSTSLSGYGPLVVLLSASLAIGLTGIILENFVSAEASLLLFVASGFGFAILRLKLAAH